MRITDSIRAAVDRIVPADDRFPGGWDGGVAAYIEESPDLAWAEAPVERLGDRLEQLAAPEAFADLAPDRQDELLRTVEADEGFAALRRVVFEGYYAAREGATPAGLTVVGFRAVPEGVEPVEPDLVPDIGVAGVRRSYDAVVVGSGPGGGVAAQVLTQAGRSVLVIERAQRVPNSALRGDHLRGKRNAVYRPTAGAGAGHPRIAQTPDGDIEVDGTGDANLYGLNADTMGGGTRLWQGMAWRFLPEDFRMASTYGNPEGASLADWPVDYDEMEPFYAKAERELGVSGEQGGLTGRTPRSSGYPMPGFPTERARELLGDAADRLGWGWGPIPLALNSVPHDGRPACVRCAQCVGHACPVNAKNGSYNTFLPRAHATGRCDVLYDAEVIEVRDGHDRASVTVMGRTSTTPVQLTVDADVVVVSAGAVESARLLLASGIGNDHMGRHLHDHRYSTILGQMDEPVKPYVGPGHSVATLDHVHGATIPWGGGVLVDLMSLLPLTWASNPLPGVPRWGAGHKAWMAGPRAHAFGVFGMGQEIPMPESRVTLAAVTDRWGRPGAALRKLVHPASEEVEAGMSAYGERWLVEAGAHDVAHPPRGNATASAAGEHSSGTARMGLDPAASATDAFGRPWGTRRVVVCDSSLHTTNGSVNPTLTITANAFRVAEHLVADWPNGRTA